jgi:CRP/FNR family transcriptional regulator, cyclic AMP receptor protein
MPSPQILPAPTPESPASPVMLNPTPRLELSGGPTLPSRYLLQVLREVPMFHSLPEPLLGLLSARAQLRRHARDDVIVRQDSVDGLLFVLRQGRAHVERAGDNGRTVLLDVLGPGAFIGEMSLIDGAPHSANVRCVQACEVLVLRGAEVMHCQAQSPEFSQAWAIALVRRLRETNQRIMSMSLDGVRERVLWQLTQWSELVPPAGRVVSNRIGRNELARMVGASREMVCRVLRSLQAAGIVELRRDRSILLRDRQTD